MDQKNGSILSRRSMLKGAAGIGGGIAMASFAGALGVSAAEGDDSPQTILNLAATAETLAVTFYYSAITGATFSLDDADVAYLKFALDAEQYHLDFLTSQGGKSLTDKFYVPSTLLSDPLLFVQVATQAETAFVGAYLAATRAFGNAGLGKLAATAAQHACSEAQHLALAREIGGLVPNNLAVPLPIYYNVSNAVPTLAPFLSAREGFIGPVSYPGIDKVNSVRIKSDPTKLYVFAY
jgi:hypothetical protein